MSELTILGLICALFFLFKSVLTEFDYCSIHCIDGNQNIQHIICERQNQCSLPALECFNFENSNLTSTERQLILDEHNHLRNTIALGEANYSINKITVSNMNELKWNDELEYIALCVVNTCRQYWKGIQLCLDTKDAKSGKNIAYKRISVPTHNLGSPEKLKEHINGWYSEIESLTEEKVDAFPRDNSSEIQRVSQMIWAATTSIGCARSIYGQYTTMFACIYSPSGNINGKSIFVKGPPCSRCEYGTCSKTYKGLCNVLENRTSYESTSSAQPTLQEKITQVTTDVTEDTPGVINQNDEIILVKGVNGFNNKDGKDVNLSSMESYDDNLYQHRQELIPEKMRVEGGSAWINGRKISDFSKFVVFVVLQILCIMQ